jgi:Flp pilus assembly protein TadG
MSARRFITELRRSRDGSAAVEFALLAPMMFAMLFGVLQIGVTMRAYNALRSISADVGRQVLVEYQNNNHLTNAQIQQLGRAAAVTPPYMLDNTNVNVNVVDAAAQRVSGAREITFSITYTIPSLVSVLHFPSLNIAFSRPIFVPA